MNHKYKYLKHSKLYRTKLLFSFKYNRPSISHDRSTLDSMGKGIRRIRDITRSSRRINLPADSVYINRWPLPIRDREVNGFPLKTWLYYIQIDGEVLEKFLPPLGRSHSSIASSLVQISRINA